MKAKNTNPTMRKEGSCKGATEVKPTNVNPDLVGKAVSALIKYHNEQVAKKEESATSLSLLGTDLTIQVQFGLEVAPGQARKVVRVDIPNPIHQTSINPDDEGLEEADVCLIVKDESKPWIQEMVEEYNELMGCVKKVLTLDSLRKKYSRYQQRRELVQKYDIFMADDRILPLLTSALGKDFVKAKKLPLPLSITRKAALPFTIQKNLSSTFMTVSQGTSITIRAGNTGMPEKKLVENVIAIAENAGTKVPRKWANIRSIAIKTPESTSLPFYHKLPEELVAIAKLAGLAPSFKPSVVDDNNQNKEIEDKDDNESQSRKRDLAAKSPLVRALKKQKKGSKDNGKAKTEKSVEEETSKSPSSNKKKSSRSSTNNDGEATKVPKKKRKDCESEATPEASKKTEKPKSAKTEKKSKVAEAEAKEQPKSAEKLPKGGEKKEFVASKKYKGSKQGYVFRSGNQGVGYYVDVKPVVDKMMLQALMRASAQGGGGKGRSRSHSAGKRRGRR